MKLLTANGKLLRIGNAVVRIGAIPLVELPTEPIQTVTGKIPYHLWAGDYAYQPDLSDNNYTQWFDGTATNTITSTPSSFSTKNLFDPRVTLLNFPPSTVTSLHQIRYYDGYGQDLSYPLKTTLLLTDGREITGAIPDYNGTPPGGASQWYTYDIPEEYRNVRAVKLSLPLAGGNYPMEIEFHGEYSLVDPVVAPIARVPFENMVGYNAFPWNRVASQVDRFVGVGWMRGYDDWHLMEKTKDVYTFATASSGGWKIDDGYTDLKALGVKSIMCPKTVPDFLVKTYPLWERDSENSYHKYKGNIARYANLSSFPTVGTTSAVDFPFTSNEPTTFLAQDTSLCYLWDGSTYVLQTANNPEYYFSVFTQADVDTSRPGAVLGKLRSLYNEKLDAARLLPATYVEFAELAFQIAARYGTNVSLPDSLVLTSDKKKALNLLNGVEAGNEMTAGWKGRKRFMTGFEYAALMSAFFDGHKGTLGTRAGVKLADPNMDVFVGGIPSANPVVYRQMLDWCAIHRGRDSEGNVDAPWNAVKYHSYTTSAGLEQHTGSDRYAIPLDMHPQSQAQINKFKSLHLEMIGRTLPVHIGEWGYDTTPTPQSTPELRNTVGTVIRTRKEMQALWGLRDMTLFNWSGVDSLQVYLLESIGGYNYETSTTLYSTSGWFNRGEENPPSVPKPAAYAARQKVRLLRGYVPVEEVSDSDIRVYKFQKDNLVVNELWAQERVVGGISEGVVYRSPVNLTFGFGTSTLNGNPVVSGTVISANGSYVFVNNDNGVIRTINFSVDTSLTQEPSVKATFYSRPQTYTLSLTGVSIITVHRLVLDGNDMETEMVSIDGSYTLTLDEEPIYVSYEEPASIDPNPELPSHNNQMTMEVTYASAPSDPTIENAAVFGHKGVVWMWMMDDSKSSGYTAVFPYFQGGTVGGTQYPGKAYTDGAGGTLYPHSGLAVVVMNPDESAQLVGSSNTTYFTWEQLAEMVEKGDSIMNHQYGGPNPDRIYQVHENTKVIYNELKARGQEYVMRSLVVPAADLGYTHAALQLGYKVISSAFGVGSHDGYAVTNPPFRANQLNMVNTLLARGFVGDAITSDMISSFNTLIAGADKNNPYVQLMFSHGPDATTLPTFASNVDHLFNIANDNLWVPSPQEFYEYLEVKQATTKTHTLVGSKLVVQLDQSALEDSVRDRKMSFLISGGVVSNVQVTNADKVTFLAQPDGRTLVNVYKTKKVFLAPVKPPHILDESVISFEPLANRYVNSPAFTIPVSSSNTISPIMLVSSNSSILSVEKIGSDWIGTPLGIGTATITATQTAANGFKEAVSLTRYIKFSTQPQTVPAVQTVYHDPFLNTTGVDQPLSYRGWEAFVGAAATQKTTGIVTGGGKGTGTIGTGYTNPTNSAIGALRVSDVTNRMIAMSPVLNLNIRPTFTRWQQMFQIRMYSAYFCAKVNGEWYVYNEGKKATAEQSTMGAFSFQAQQMDTDLTKNKWVKIAFTPNTNLGTIVAGSEVMLPEGVLEQVGFFCNTLYGVNTAAGTLSFDDFRVDGIPLT